MRRSSLSTLALVLAATHVSAASAAGYYGSKDRGWFWYEPEPEVEEAIDPGPVIPLKKEEPPQELSLAPPPEPAAVEPEGPAPLSSLWLKENLETYQFKAMDNPTVDNVAAYLYLQRLMVDKASAFADAGQVAIAMYPELSNDARRPRTDSAAMALSRRAGEAQRGVFKKITDGGKITFVFSSQCGEFCDPQFAAIKTFQTNTDVEIEFISADGKLPDGVQIAGDYVNPKRIRELGVTHVPSLYFTPAGGEPTFLTSTVMPYNTMVSSIVAIGYGKGWITHQEYESTKGRENYAIRLDQDEEIPQEVLDDPVKLAVFLRERLLKD